MILPLPVKKNKLGQKVADLSTTEYYRQIEEEVLEAYENAVMFQARKIDIIIRLKEALGEGNIPKVVIDELKRCPQRFTVYVDDEAEELVDVITTCITRLEIIGYDEIKRQELYQAVNEKNRKRDYFED